MASHTDYGVKLYDKTAWEARGNNPLPTGVHRLRYELVPNRARSVEALLKQQQVTLADLGTLAVYEAGAAALLEHWEQTIRVKPLDFTGLKLKDASLLQSGGCLNYWRGLRAAKVPAVTIKRHKAKYGKLLAESDKRTANDAYSQLVPAAIMRLVPVAAEVETDTILRTCNQLETAPLETAKNAAALSYSPPLMMASPKTDDEGQSEGEMTKGSSRSQCCCKTCGRPIGTGNAKAKFCSAKEVGPAAAKRCRNADSNPRNNLRNALRQRESRNERQPCLFDVRPFVRVPEQMREFVLASDNAKHPKNYPFAAVAGRSVSAPAQRPAA